MRPHAEVPPVPVGQGRVRGDHHSHHADQARTRRDTGARFVPRDVTARRIARLVSECPDFDLNDDQDLAALFKHCTGFGAAPRWLPKLRAEARAQMGEVGS